jgi:NADPH2:quinone reductase
MKALVSVSPGGPETLVIQEVAEPQLSAGQVLVSIVACGVNFPDSLIIQDKYQFQPDRPFSPGGEFAGFIEKVSEGVEHLHVGDRVLGSEIFGAMAEKIAIDAAKVFKIPDCMPFDEAAAFLMTYATSYYALKDRGNLQAGETLLVLGAAGGVGLAAVELGKAFGARVIAATSSVDKTAFCIKHGADAGLVYSPNLELAAMKALAEDFKSAVAPGADVIFDPVGGNYTEAALRAASWDGRLLVIGFAAGAIPKIPVNIALLKSCSIVGVFLGGLIAKRQERYRRLVDELFALYEAGKIRPIVSESFTLSRGGEAISRLASRSAVGKLIITMPDHTAE